MDWTPEDPQITDLRIMLAELIGWRFDPSIPIATLSADRKRGAEGCWIRPGGDDWQLEWLPRLNLELTHQAEKKLDERGLLDVYRHMLRAMVATRPNITNPAENYEWHADAHTRALCIQRALEYKLPSDLS